MFSQQTCFASIGVVALMGCHHPESIPETYQSIRGNLARMPKSWLKHQVGADEYDRVTKGWAIWADYEEVKRGPSAEDQLWYWEEPPHPYKKQKYGYCVVRKNGKIWVARISEKP